MTSLHGPFVGLTLLCVARVVFHVGLGVSVALGVGLPEGVPVDVLEMVLRVGQFITLLVFLGGAEGIRSKGEPPRGTSTSDSVVLSFFIPFANLILPARNIGALVSRLAHRAGRMQSPTALVYVWWMTWIGTTISSSIMGVTPSQTSYMVYSATFIAMMSLEIVLANTIRTLADEGDRATEADPLEVANVFS